MNFSPPPKVAALVVILPNELIVEVLTFLEVKSLMRMKCVCKSWKTLISKPLFVKMHLKKQPSRMTHFAFIANKFEGSGDCRAIPISRVLETTSNSITLTDDDDPYYRFIYKDASAIVGSCNGLVCLQQGRCYLTEDSEHSLIFWNPATRTIFENLVCFRSFLKPPDAICKFAFGYDNSTDTYKVVSLLFFKKDDGLITTVVRVFTLGENIWRDIDCLPVVFVHHHFFMFADGVYLNNSINWFVCHRKNLNIDQFVIISLDLGTETYTRFLPPQFCVEDLKFPPNLFVCMDCLCFSYDFKRTHFVIWQMKEFVVEESWTQFLRISYLDLQMDYKLRELDPYYIPEFIVKPLCLSENGNTAIFAINREDQAILYNWRDNRVKRIKSTNKIWWSISMGYVESLVSTS